MDYLTPDLKQTDEELKTQAKLNFKGLPGEQINFTKWPSNFSCYFWSSKNYRKDR